MNPKAQQIVNACEAVWDANQADCNAFVRAVANQINVTITDGNADAIVDWLRQQEWTSTQDGFQAEQWTEAGQFVVAGLKAADHAPPRANGHVVVIVPGPLAHGKYPPAYWGSLDGVGKKNTTINFAWRTVDRDKVAYFAKAF